MGEEAFSNYEMDREPIRRGAALQPGEASLSK
jgi:hypothetical protein